MEFGLARLTAAGVKGSLHGVEVELHPLTLGDWGKIENYMRQQIISAADKCCVGVPDNRARTIMREALREAGQITITSPAVKDGLFTSLGTMLQIIYLSLSKWNQNITVDKVNEMIGNDFDCIAKMVKVIFDISFPASRGELKNEVTGAAGTK